VKRLAPALAVLLLVAACDSGGDAVPTSSVGTVPSTTTTTMDVEVCGEVADEAVAWVEDLVEALDGVTYDQLVDREQWPEELASLDARGTEMQARSDAAGCDEGLIRGAVVSAAAEMEAAGRAGQMLLDLISPGG